MKEIILADGFKFTEELLTNFRTTENSIIYEKGDTEKIFPLPKKDDRTELKNFQKNEIKELIIK